MQNEKDAGAPLTGGPVDRSVRQVEDELRELAYERAGGFASGDDGRYDPQLLDVMIRGADEIELLRKELEIFRSALSYAIKEADGWHDDSHGGPIEDEEMDRVRALLTPNDEGEKPLR